MFSIFKPPDPAEPPAAGGTGFKARNVLTGPFAPRLYDPLWKTLLTWVWLPALLVFLSLEIWIGIPQIAAWLVALGFMVGYAVLGWVAYRKRRG
jgi:hypothetical protein